MCHAYKDIHRQTFYVLFLYGGTPVACTEALASTVMNIFGMDWSADCDSPFLLTPVPELTNAVLTQWP